MSKGMQVGVIAYRDKDGNVTHTQPIERRVTLKEKMKVEIFNNKVIDLYTSLFLEWLDERDKKILEETI